MILIGRIIGTHGIKGVLKIKPFTDFSARFDSGEILCVKVGNNSFKHFQIESSTGRKNFFLIKVKDVDDLSEAEKLVTKEIVIDEIDLKNLESDSYYIHDLIGLKVLNENGIVIGELSNVLQLQSNDVYEIIDKIGKKFLIPAVRDFLEEINLELGIMKLKNTEGMFD